MTTYRLPDWLGGHECELVEHDGAATTVKVPTPSGGSAQVTIHNALLTEVVPPLPAEPPNGTVLGNGLDAAIRIDDPSEDDPKGRWWVTGVGAWRRWGEWAHGYTRLAPDPVADAPALPWKWIDAGGIAASVGRCTAPGVAASIQADDVHLTPNACREMAGVLWRAARDHEEAGRG